MNQDLCKYIGIGAAKKSKRLILLGASGSIGQTSLGFLKQRSDIELVGLSVHTSLDFVRNYLRQEEEEKQPKSKLSHIAISSLKYTEETKELSKEYPHISFYVGPEGMLEMIYRAYHQGHADTILTAIVGAVGIRATLLAIELGMKIALANKEALVTAGPVIQNALLMAKKNSKQVSLIPVDSEHNSVFRLVYAQEAKNIGRVILTASGGPFIDLASEDLASITKNEVLRHPTWSMGPKITVDSAGMINKGLEIIEAHYLFALPYAELGVWIQRNSLIHALLELCDGSYCMHASSAHMIFPIAHALLFPDTMTEFHPQAQQPPQWPNITFEEVNKTKYPGFYIAIEAGKMGGSAPAIFNGANEVAVAAFLADQIHFTQIVDVIHSVMDCAQVEHGLGLEIFLAADAWARKQAQLEVEKKSMLV